MWKTTDSSSSCLIRLSKKLKGLFTLFAGQIISHAANILNQLNSSKTEQTTTTTTTTTGNEFTIHFRKKYLEENQLELINGILGTISNLCLFDSVGFISDERFQLLMMPIVDQVRVFSINPISLFFIRDLVGKSHIE